MPLQVREKVVKIKERENDPISAHSKSNQLEKGCRQGEGGEASLNDKSKEKEE